MSQNILENRAAMAILREAKSSLEQLGVACILSPMDLPQGMTISLHIGSTELAAIAANVASTQGGVNAHTVDGADQFAREVAFAAEEIKRQSECKR
ncbi:MAG: hypothetical protein FD131_3245 [Rhodocyclaceae bacterium]|nr:MAG: hypothetical protein FD131_3245 [Rhodocyclaceae bacterium]